MNEAAKIYEKKEMALSSESIAKLCKYDWPGNIRELKNCISQAVLFSKNNVLSESDFNLLNKPEINSKGRRGGLRKKVVVDIANLESILKTTGGNVSQCAKKLGISRVKLYQILRNAGINVDLMR
jgi:DNA-binding NtrC family response regulator